MRLSHPTDFPCTVFLTNYAFLTHNNSSVLWQNKPKSAISCRLLPIPVTAALARHTVGPADPSELARVLPGDVLEGHEPIW